LRVSIEEVARITGGRLIGPPGLVATGAAIDSRAIKAGELFFALKGEFFDGHDFVDEAGRAGAAAAVVSAELNVDGPQIVVADPAVSLVALAGWVRDELDPLVVGITGSTGKTGVKDLLSCVAATRMATVASPGSFNNDLGVPLTLLQTKQETEVVICEMGSRGPGHIRKLCKYARPHVGIVTNVGVTHFEQFGSREAVASAKSELIEAIAEGGTAVLNADDAFTLEMAPQSRGDVITFGSSASAMLRGDSIRFNSLGQPTFRVSYKGNSVWVHVPLAGVHQVANALAACAGGVALGLSLDECKLGLDGAVASPWRMAVKVVQGVFFVNDAYNANPDSVAAALKTCAAMTSPGSSLVAVLGYMAELGDIEEAEHRRAGALAAALAARLVVVGEKAAPIADGARDAGMAEVRWARDAEHALTAIGDLRPKDVLLVKGSRVARLEHLADKAASVFMQGVAN